MAITHARVTNNNDFPISDMYDGVPLVFEPGKPQRIPLAAAVLFFDMPVDVEGKVTWQINGNSWAHFSRRQGWTNIEPQQTPHGMESVSGAYQRVTKQAAEWCAKIKVDPVRMISVETTEEETLPEPRDTAISGNVTLPPPEEGAEEAEGKPRRGRR